MKTLLLILAAALLSGCGSTFSLQSPETKYGHIGVTYTAPEGFEK